MRLLQGYPGCSLAQSILKARYIAVLVALFGLGEIGMPSCWAQEFPGAEYESTEDYQDSYDQSSYDQDSYDQDPYDDDVGESDQATEYENEYEDYSDDQQESDSQYDTQMEQELDPDLANTLREVKASCNQWAAESALEGEELEIFVEDCVYSQTGY